eukprot:TRINITY_DN111462_c0_g1_i1.p2 TRINITY_DN111462_c0_g1~~TRINITY_DN111462_c0_g1_i1.p2  ORF type:complete len:109 (-),score=30.14 TRINITY_DN111462_c0_g1_i1:477-803(-)
MSSASGPRHRRYFDENGKLVTEVVNDGRPPPRAPSSSTSSSKGGGLTYLQKMALGAAAVFVGPSLLLQAYDKLTTESVDLSSFNVVTQYDKPATEMMDDTVRIQFCAS